VLESPERVCSADWLSNPKKPMAEDTGSKELKVGAKTNSYHSRLHLNRLGSLVSYTDLLRASSTTLLQNSIAG
jgi:hypothetical protein